MMTTIMKDCLDWFNLKKNLTFVNELPVLLGGFLIKLMDKINRFCAQYPSLLKQIFDPPTALYVKGFLQSGAGRGKPKYVAMVGTRMPSDYGRKMAYEIAGRVTECGGVVVSGLAFGIDAVCHQAAVDMNKPTVAVIASGINKITPTSHRKLADDIINCGGCIISESKDSDPSLKYRYLKRNRIISGMCEATIVIEAKERSGALITARHALDQNRDVYSLMGDLNRVQAKGCLKAAMNCLAQPIFDIDRLMEDLGFDIQKSAIASLNFIELEIIKIITDRPLNTDEIVEISGMNAADVNTALTQLEIQSLIIRGADGRFSSI